MKSQKLWELTKAITVTERAIMTDTIKNWREIKILYDQITIAIDGQDLGSTS